MEHTDDVVVALARAYGLSEIVESDDERLRRLAGQVRDGLADHGPLTLVVDGWEGRVDGRKVEDPDRFVAEMVRDLAAAGVRELRFDDGVETGPILDFLDALRRGAGSGDPEATTSALRDGPDGVRTTVTEDPSGSPDPSGEIASLFGEGAEGEEPSPAAPDDEDGIFAAGVGDDVGGDEEAGTGEVEDAAAGPAGGREEASAGEVGEEDADTPAGGREEAAPGEELDRLVGAYLEAGPDERDERARALLERAEAVREAGRNEGVAEAVMRLAVAAREGTGDPEALEMAREMTTIGVAAHVAVRLVGVRDEEERERLIQAAGGLGRPMAEAVSDALADTNDRAARRTCIDTLLALGEPGIREAENMIDDRRWFVVRNGVTILGEVGGERAVEHLTSALGHDDPRVRREAVMALARIGGDDAGDLLVGLVDDPDPDVRAAVAMALGVLNVERAVKPLLQRLEQESDEDVEVQIIRGLGALGDPGAVPAIEKRAVASFFSRPPTPLRIAAYKALSDIGTPHAMELLEEAADERDPEVRETVRSILRTRED